MIGRTMTTVAGIAALMAVPAMAQDRAVRGSHTAIAAGDLAKAEKLLLADQRIYGARPELLINLAAVYARSGRVADATATYRQVLAQPDAMMDLSTDRTVSAHALARTGLARLQPAIATR